MFRSSSANTLTSPFLIKMCEKYRWGQLTASNASACRLVVRSTDRFDPDVFANGVSPSASRRSRRRSATRQQSTIDVPGPGSRSNTSRSGGRRPPGRRPRRRGRGPRCRHHRELRPMTWLRRPPHSRLTARSVLFARRPLPQARRSVSGHRAAPVAADTRVRDPAARRVGAAAAAARPSARVRAEALHPAGASGPTASVMGGGRSRLRWRLLRLGRSGRRGTPAVTPAERAA